VAMIRDAIPSLDGFLVSATLNVRGLSLPGRSLAFALREGLAFGW